ncbi:TrmH family RNA methyltransferase [Carboxylicivirga taeanensis]|uniref:TrmH family RNA methyltransferase n=1 Tax=Carboxylicivirga taeanensis TaxID=1416875 RepID=UPI003F6E3990
MLSKNKQKFILSLNRKKIRDQNGVFVAEGHKLVTDLLSSNCPVESLIATDSWLQSHASIVRDLPEIISATPETLKKISTLKSPPQVIGIFKQQASVFSFDALKDELCLLLDEVQDPGNLGTIIRLADWFGITNVFCSENCADVYNSKTIQSTMGAISRVAIHYVDASAFLKEYTSLNIPVYGTFLDGNNIYQQALKNQGLIVMGNEGKGISQEVEHYVTHRLFIPSFPSDIPTSESLNVSVATAITCAEFRRQAK